MDSPPTFERPLRDFLAFARVEAGLATSTLEAYARDLNDLTTELEARGVIAPSEVSVEDLATHLRWLSRDRELQASSVARHLATIRVFFVGCVRTASSIMILLESWSGPPDGRSFPACSVL